MADSRLSFCTCLVNTYHVALVVVGQEDHDDGTTTILLSVLPRTRAPTVDAVRLIGEQRFRGVVPGTTQMTAPTNLRMTLQSNPDRVGM